MAAAMVGPLVEAPVAWALVAPALVRRALVAASLGAAWPGTGLVRRVRVGAALVATVLVAATGCSGGPTASGPPSPSPAKVATGTAAPLPQPVPSGRLVADLRQSSRDLALGRIQVWITNDTRYVVTPTRIRYEDPRLAASVEGQRLRGIPAGSFRGYPLPLPAPACRGRRVAADEARTGSALTVWAGDGPLRMPVADENDLVNRYVAGRCLELEVARLVDLRFADRVEVTGSGPGSTATLALLAAPTGRPGTVVVRAVHGTPVVAARGTAYWSPRRRIRGDGRRTARIELPAIPARCDAHAFMEAGGATAFRVDLLVDGRPGQIVLRMGQAAAQATIRAMLDSCGLP